MNQIVKLTKEFEGSEILTLEYNGKPCWIARQVGAAIGYSSNGSKLPKMISQRWSDEFEIGQDYDILTGDELRDFNSFLDVGPQKGPTKAATLMLLFESGMHMALVKTNKPAGKKLRKFITREVLPQIARDGAYLPEREIKENQLAVKDELAFKKRMLDLEERKFKTDAYKSLAGVIRGRPEFGEDIAYMYDVCAAEVATGQSLSGLKPVAPQKWEMASEIGKRHGTSAIEIGKLAGKLGLKGPGQYSRSEWTVAPVSHKPVRTWVYSPAAVAIIERNLQPRLI
jgi:prophage antirepressor-like protein